VAAAGATSLSDELVQCTEKLVWRFLGDVVGAGQRMSADHGDFVMMVFPNAEDVAGNKVAAVAPERQGGALQSSAVTVVTFVEFEVFVESSPLVV
jgi:hypothetical protein